MKRYRIVLEAIVTVNLAAVEALSPGDALAKVEREFNGAALLNGALANGAGQLQFSGDFDGVTIDELDHQGAVTQTWIEGENGRLTLVPKSA